MTNAIVKAPAQKAIEIGSLFAGIEGFGLGFKRAGLECVWQVEIDPTCQKVLSRHWPNTEKKL